MNNKSRTVDTESVEDVSFYNFDPERLQSLIMMQNWEACWDYMDKLIASFSVKMGFGVNFNIQQSLDSGDGRDYAEEFAGLMGELLLSVIANQQSVIPDEQFCNLIFYHEVIHTFFYLRGIENTDALVMRMLKDNKKLDKNQQKKLLLLLSLNTEMDIVSILKKTDRFYNRRALPAYMSYLKTFTRNIYENKARLYELRHYLERNDLSMTDVKLLISVYFSCSYSNEANKHDVKENINRSIQNYYRQFRKEFKDLQSRAPIGLAMDLDENKPKLAVHLEIFSKGHAMRRSYGEWIKSLQSQFNVAIFIHEKACDESMVEEFDNVFTYKSFTAFSHLIHNYEPDMVFFPSVGMSVWGIATANLRLAPIQMMALGHPATTKSPNIDYVYGQSHLYTLQAFDKEIYIADDAPYKFSPYLSKEEFAAYDTNKRAKNPDRPLQVTIVGAEFKIIYPFVEILQELERDESLDIHFRFHLSSTGMDTLHVERELSKLFKNYTFQGYQRYREYLQSLADTDIVLNPFPFGHTNTIIDTLLLGKPCVSMEGSEPSSRTEKYILDIVKPGEKFLVQSKEAYIAKFKELAAQIMQGNTEFYDRGKVYDLIYGHVDDRVVDFGKHIKWVYDHHDEIQKAGDKMVAIPEVSYIE